MLQPPEQAAWSAYQDEDRLVDEPEDATGAGAKPRLDAEARSVSVARNFVARLGGTHV